MRMIRGDKAVFIQIVEAYAGIAKAISAVVFFRSGEQLMLFIFICKHEIAGLHRALYAINGIESRSLITEMYLAQ